MEERWEGKRERGERRGRKIRKDRGERWREIKERE